MIKLWNTVVAILTPRPYKVELVSNFTIGYWVRDVLVRALLINTDQALALVQETNTHGSAVVYEGSRKNARAIANKINQCVADCQFFECTQPVGLCVAPR